MWMKKKINVLVVGDKGQLGSILKRILQEDAKLEKSMFNIVDGVDLPEIDISSPYPLERWLNRNVVCQPVKFHYVINCAAATDTTKIECDPEARDMSYKANVLGPSNIAEACAFHGSKLIHVSTDYVFSEKSIYDPTTIDDPMLVADTPHEFPTNIYGLHKLLGEKMIECAFKKNPKDFLILRTSWLYGNSEQSFPIKFLKNCLKSANESPDRSEVEVVNDCFGRPTSVQYLARFIIEAMKLGISGKLDAQSTTAPMSRFEFAKHILETWNQHISKSEGSESNDLDLSKVVLKPSKSDDSKTKVHHPRKMPALQVNGISVTTVANLNEMKNLKRIIEEIEFKSSDAFEMYDDWLIQSGGFKMISKALRDFKTSLS